MKRSMMLVAVLMSISGFGSDTVISEGQTSCNLQGSKYLNRLVLPSTLTTLMTGSFNGCRNLEKVYCYFDPFDIAEPTIALWLPALTAQADEIWYERNVAKSWEKVLWNSGYCGRMVCFEGSWPNVSVVQGSGSSPAVSYEVKAGSASVTTIAGAAGWDAFGLPDGMIWNREQGVLSGTATIPGTYDVLLVGGSGTSTQVMRTKIVVRGYDTITGWVGVNFSQGGAPLDRLSSYSKLPSGLKWNKTTKILSGVPTKVQVLDLKTSEGVPVRIEIKPLPIAIGTERRTISDPFVLFFDEHDAIDARDYVRGTLTSTVTSGGKLTVKVQTAKKTYSFQSKAFDLDIRFAYDDFFMEWSVQTNFVARMTLSTGERLEAVYSCFGDVFGGNTFSESFSLSGGEFRDGNDISVLSSIQTEVSPRTLLFGFTPVENTWSLTNDVTAINLWDLRAVEKKEKFYLQASVKKDGTVSFSGKLPNGVSISCSGTAYDIVFSDEPKLREDWVEIVGDRFDRNPCMPEPSYYEFPEAYTERIDHDYFVCSGIAFSGKKICISISILQDLLHDSSPVGCVTQIVR